MKIKKNDNVIVTTGKDKGATGTVTQIFPRERKLVVSGVNTKKKHTRARGKGEKGEIVEMDAPIDISNVSLIDPESGKPTRVGAMTKNDGTKVRASKRSGKEI